MPQKQEVKKHVAAVHINNKLSLLQRKVSNVLLLNAYDNLLTRETHSIKLNTLCDMVGFESNDHQVVKAALRALAHTVLEWNILDDQGEHEWGVSAMLAHATIKRGICTYEYSSTLRQKLYNPDIYARINVSIQRKFSSGHTLALYENCVRFKSVGTTGWLWLETLRKLLGVSESKHYDAFKNLNREILKRAIKEVNETSDILVVVKFKKEKRCVVAVKFDINENLQLSLPLPKKGTDALVTSASMLDTEILPEHPVRERLLAFGLSKKQADQILNARERVYIEEILDLVERDYQAGKIDNLPAYTISALREDYRPKRTVYEQTLEDSQELRATQVRRLEELQELLSKLRSEFDRQVLQQAIEGLTKDQRKELEDAFLDGVRRDGNFIGKFLSKGGLENRVVKGAFLAFAKKRLVRSSERADFERFLQGKGLDLFAMEHEVEELRRVMKVGVHAAMQRN